MSRSRRADAVRRVADVDTREAVLRLELADVAAAAVEHRDTLRAGGRFALATEEKAEGDEERNAPCRERLRVDKDVVGNGRHVLGSVVQGASGRNTKTAVLGERPFILREAALRSGRRCARRLDDSNGPPERTCGRVDETFNSPP